MAERSSPFSGCKDRNYFFNIKGGILFFHQGKGHLHNIYIILTFTNTQRLQEIKLRAPEKEHKTGTASTKYSRKLK